MTVALKAPMSEELVWANIMRPRIPLIYLDLNTIIYFAKALRGDTDVPTGYLDLYETVIRAKSEQRAMFPLGESHLWEITKITDPSQRERLAEVFEAISDFNYLPGRVSESPSSLTPASQRSCRRSRGSPPSPLLRPTFWQVFGMVGGMKIVDADGLDSSKAVQGGDDR